MVEIWGGDAPTPSHPAAITISNSDGAEISNIESSGTGAGTALRIIGGKGVTMRDSKFAG